MSDTATNWPTSSAPSTRAAARSSTVAKDASRSKSSARSTVRRRPNVPSDCRSTTTFDLVNLRRLRYAATVVGSGDPGSVKGVAVKKKRRPLVDYLVYLAVRLVVGFAQALTIEQSYALAEFMANILYHVDK